MPKIEHKLIPKKLHKLSITSKIRKINISISGLQVNSAPCSLIIMQRMNISKMFVTRL